MPHSNRRLSATSFGQTQIHVTQRSLHAISRDPDMGLAIRARDPDIAGLNRQIQIPARYQTTAQSRVGKPNRIRLLRKRRIYRSSRKLST